MASKICFASISWDMLVHRITLMFFFCEVDKWTYKCGIWSSRIYSPTYTVPMSSVFGCYSCLYIFIGCYSCHSYFSFWWLDWFFFLPILFDKECKFYFRKAPIWQIFVQAIFKLRFLPMQNLNLNKPLVIQNFAFLNISSIISKKEAQHKRVFCLRSCGENTDFWQIIAFQSTINIFSF